MKQQMLRDLMVNLLKVHHMLLRNVVDIVHGIIVNVWPLDSNADQEKVRKVMNLAMESKEEVVAVLMAVVAVAVVKKVEILAMAVHKDVTDHDVIMIVIIVDHVALVHNSNNNKAKMVATVVHVMTKVNRVATALVKVAYQPLVVVDVADVVRHHAVSIVATSEEEEVAVVHQDDHEA